MRFKVTKRLEEVKQVPCSNGMPRISIRGGMCLWGSSMPLWGRINGELP
jgi:hypothetical protein